jgi:hypothetical protein
MGTAWNRIIDHYRAGNLTRLWDAQPGLRAAVSDGDGVSGSGIGDPTGQQAAFGKGDDDDGRSDPATHSMDLFEQHLRAAFKYLDLAGVELGNWGPPRTATEADRLALARSNSKPDPRCEHCATVESNNGTTGGHWSDVDSRRCRSGPTEMVDRSTGQPRLRKALFLCTWCADWTEVKGSLPPKAALEAHRDGRRVMERDITPRRSA